MPLVLMRKTKRSFYTLVHVSTGAFRAGVRKVYRKFVLNCLVCHPLSEPVFSESQLIPLKTVLESDLVCWQRVLPFIIMRVNYRWRILTRSWFCIMITFAKLFEAEGLVLRDGDTPSLQMNSYSRRFLNLFGNYTVWLERDFCTKGVFVMCRFYLPFVMCRFHLPLGALLEENLHI